MRWRVATVTAVRDETPSARTLVLRVAGWPAHLAGQHVDIRLTAPDGYTAVRSYSVASAPEGERVEVTIDRLPDGEVSPYLTEIAAVGDLLEVRGPIGGWFVWRPGQPGPTQLVAGGSGIVPLMAMVRTRAATAATAAPMRLLYSARGPESTFYRDELDILSAGSGVELTYAYTRTVPAGWPLPAGRVDAARIAASTVPPSLDPSVYVCGPTGFVEAVADLIIKAGHDPRRVRTERFGPSGGSG